MGLASPHLLIAAGSAIWGAMHKGSAVKLETSKEGSLTARLTFPPRLFNRLLVESWGRSIQAAIDHSRAKSSAVRLIECSDSHGLFEAQWQ